MTCCWRISCSAAAWRDQVRLHAKPFPTYVSDATIPDIRALVAHLAQAPEPGVRDLGKRLQAYLDDDRLHLQTSLFWTSPLPAWEMPPELRQELTRAGLLISKGDANYRRWLGDRHWPFYHPDPADHRLPARPAALVARHEIGDHRRVTARAAGKALPGRPDLDVRRALGCQLS